jgi:periplasmic protein CpxP/Spy
MTESNETTTKTPPAGDEHGAKRRWRWTRRALFGGAIATALAGAGVWISHAQQRHHGWHHAGHSMGAMDAESAGEWAQLATRQMLRRIDASSEQQSRIEAIVAGAVKDLVPLRDAARMAREEAIKLVTAPAVDRAAIERLRAGQIAVHEQASKRIAAAIGDIADVLTPAQREELTRMMVERRWGRHR